MTPAKRESNVDLPEPVRATMPRNSPSCTFRLMFLSTGSEDEGYEKVTLRNSKSRLPCINACSLLSDWRGSGDKIHYRRYHACGNGLALNRSRSQTVSSVAARRQMR